ncbi:histidine kinase N-terminal 7TM domain-containing protein [Halobaculum limi]|uniref:histidine kinase N-terminal 7TM domain-containing protein n=1 Tax=Halobaculum limi TaxID=3031916 RepID=UPI002406930D|nr:histidine kinase N-terminal 7TM domain-containing protein [Halobaculum sp. YSMS11]
MLSDGAVVVIFAFLAGGTATAVGTYAWQNRGEPGAAPFAALMAGVAVWSLSYALALTAFDPGVRELFEVPLEIGKAIIAPAWLLFALGYTGRGEYVSRRLIAVLAVVPVVTTVLVATAPTHGLMWTNYRITPVFGAATVTFDPGPWFYVHAAFGWAVIGAGVVFLLEPVLSYGSLYRDQGIALILGTAVSFVAHVKATFFIPPVPALDLTPLTLAITGILFGFALFRFELQGLLPATQVLGRRAAIEDVGVGLVVVNADGQIIEFNGAARPVLGVDREEEAVAGTPLSTFVDDVDLKTTEPQRIEQTHAAQYRVYEATVSAIADHHDRTVGYTVTFADVTDREARRQRLEVLNRVLRHNLRNDMTVVVGNADLLAERVEEADAPLADAIRRRGRALQRLGEKARDVEEILDGDDRGVHDVSARALCRSLVEQTRESCPNADIAVDVPEGLTLTVRESVLDVVLWNLVENAAEHTDESAIRVAVRVDDDGVRFVVADDGPGIPETELESIRTGTESALSHGSGLGLWVVRWGTRILGADLLFDADDGGTTATVTLPRHVVADGDSPDSAGGDGDPVRSAAIDAPQQTPVTDGDGVSVDATADANREPRE